MKCSTVKNKEKSLHKNKYRHAWFSSYDCLKFCCFLHHKKEEAIFFGANLVVYVGDNFYTLWFLLSIFNITILPRQESNPNDIFEDGNNDQ